MRGKIDVPFGGWTNARHKVKESNATTDGLWDRTHAQWKCFALLVFGHGAWGRSAWELGGEGRHFKCFRVDWKHLYRIYISTNSYFIDWFSKMNVPILTQAINRYGNTCHTTTDDNIDVMAQEAANKPKMLTNILKWKQMMLNAYARRVFGLFFSLRNNWCRLLAVCCVPGQRRMHTFIFSILFIYCRKIWLRQQYQLT